MSTSNELTSALQALDPSGRWGTISGVFDSMEICEDVIAKARHRYPKHDAALWNAFTLLRPGTPLHNAPEPVYRAHCAEILDRVHKGLDTTLGTKAEIIMGLSETSLKSPLTHPASVLYARLFREILPHSPVVEEIALLSTWAYDSATESLLTDLAQKCRVPDRKPKKESEWRTPPVL